MNDPTHDQGKKEDTAPTKQPWLFLLSALSGFVAGGVFGFYLAGKNPLKENTEDTKSFFSSSPSPALDTEQEDKNQETAPPFSDELNPENSPPPPKNNKESVERYKKMLKKSLESELSKNSPFVWSSYGIAVADFKTQEQASAKAIEIYSQYRHWSVTTRKIKDTYKVIVGSFSDKKSAEDFLKNMQKESKFKSANIISLAEEKP